MKRIILVLLAALALTAKAQAAGMSAHMLMTDRALEEVRDPDLKSLLLTHHDALLSGSAYPDSGFALRYTAQHHGRWDYGEDSHLPTFIEAYLAHVRAVCPARGECADLTAHFLGASAHIMEDQLFDEIFLPRAEKMDFNGQPHHYDFDVSIEMLVIVDQKLWAAIPQWFAPSSDLIDVYSRLRLDVSRKEIMTGNRLLKLAMEGERMIAPWEYLRKKKGAPWFATHYDSAPGGFQFNAEIVARFWEVLWQRLNNSDAGDPLLSVYPKDGATEVAADEEFHAIFSKGVEDPTITNATFFARDQEQRPVAGTVRTARSRFGTSALVATFKPAAPLQPGATYTVFLTPGIQDLSGAPLPREYAWRLTTAQETKPGT